MRHAVCTSINPDVFSSVQQLQGQDPDSAPTPATVLANALETSYLKTSKPISRVISCPVTRGATVGRLQSEGTNMIGSQRVRKAVAGVKSWIALDVVCMGAWHGQEQERSNELPVHDTQHATTRCPWIGKHSIGESLSERGTTDRCLALASDSCLDSDPCRMFPG